MTQTIVSCRRQALKVRLVTLLTLVWCIGFTYLAVHTGQTLGIAPADGGILRPAGERWSVAALIGLIGLTPVVGMVVYSSRYVTLLEREGGHVLITVVGLLRPRRTSHPLHEVESATGYEGRMVSARGHSVHAPWVTLNVSDRSYVLDQQAELFDARALRDLVHDAIWGDER